MKKIELIIIGLILLFSIIPSLLFGNNSSKKIIEVKVGKNVIKTFDINESIIYTIEVDDMKNTIQIENGSIKVIDANCNDKLCVHQKEAKKIGDTIICLPHKMQINIK
ncbi:hypothetical protein AN641_03245 [Candidatus Epulonipiscioides gigas]|nr:hypothetical protein AN641_03245 [Epulopiscium sp. SCG-C07WGA-EpuloA2]